jgi:hypothetical protein
MWDLVCGEDDVVILEEALREEVAEGVVFLVEGEDGGIGNTCCVVGLVGVDMKSCASSLRVSSLYSTLDWPSSSRKSSNLFSSRSALYKI